MIRLPRAKCPLDLLPSAEQLKKFGSTDELSPVECPELLRLF